MKASQEARTLAPVALAVAVTCQGATDRRQGSGSQSTCAIGKLLLRWGKYPCYVCLSPTHLRQEVVKAALGSTALGQPFHLRPHFPAERRQLLHVAAPLPGVLDRLQAANRSEIPEFESREALTSPPVQVRRMHRVACT